MSLWKEYSIICTCCCKASQGDQVAAALTFLCVAYCEPAACACCVTCRPLAGSCTHSCLLLCHPGPCPPCPLLVDASCFCGKARMKQRCGNNEYSCRCVVLAGWLALVGEQRLAQLLTGGV